MASCLECKPKVVLRTSKDYLKHIKRHHYSGAIGKFLCPLCFVMFGKMNRFQPHLVRCFAKKHKQPANTNNHNPLRNRGKKSISETFESDCFSHSSTDDTICSKPLSQEIYNASPTIQANLSSCPSREESMGEVFGKIALEFALSLHSLPNFTRKDVFQIQKSITENILQKLSEYLLEKTSKCSCSIKTEISIALKAITDIFATVKSEHLLINTLKKNELLVPPKDFIINREVGITFDKGRAVFALHNTTGTLLPMSFQISQFVKRNRRIEEMVSNLEKYSQQSEAITHYVQGSTWKSMMAKVAVEEDTIYLPLGLYTDGLQYNNSLGTHTDSVDNFYYYFPLLEDPFHKNNIHLGASLRSNHIKSYGNGKCFQELVDCLLDLYYVGFEVVVKGKKKKIKFLLGLIIGDNLALNAILEYVACFRANYFCRFCTLNREEAGKVCYEVLSKLRTIDNYKVDLQIADSSKTGVKGDCVFNQICYFHSILNRVLEIMHDFFEGINKYVICKVLLLFIEKKTLTLDEINACIADLDYDNEEVKYIPKAFEIKKLKENNLKMSARESWQFIYLLPVCLGDRIPENNEAWQLILCLIEIIEILLGSSFYECTLDHLRKLITKFLQMYQNLFGDLKPKMHFTTHLPTAIRAMGPPRHYMCFKMEAYHRFFKIYAHVMPNRRNISLSFSKKYQYNFAYLLLKNEKYVKVTYGNQIETEFEEFVFPGRTFYNELNYKGTDYKATKYLPLQENGFDFLYCIKELCVFFGKIYVVGSKIAKCCFNIHLHSFVLNKNIENEIKLIPLEKFDSIPINIYKLANNREITRPRRFFNAFEDINLDYNITSF